MGQFFCSGKLLITKKSVAKKIFVSGNNHQKNSGYHTEYENTKKRNSMKGGNMLNEDSGTE